MGHASRTTGGIDRTLWFSGLVGRLSALVREDDSSGGGGPVDIRHCSRDTCSESVWRYGRKHTAATYMGPVCRRA